jgi:hypothetical protein
MDALRRAKRNDSPSDPIASSSPSDRSPKRLRRTAALTTRSRLFPKEGAGKIPGRLAGQNLLREKTNFPSQINLIWVVQPQLQKYSRSQPPQISGFNAPFRPGKGRIAIVMNAGRNVVDATAPARKMIAGRIVRSVSGSQRARRTAKTRTAKPRGPDTRCWCQAAGGELDPTGSDQPLSRQRR